MFDTMIEPTQLKRKEDRLAYIRSVWPPNATWEDVQDYANMFGIGLNTMQSYLKELHLTYLTKVDIARLSREKYLLNVWAKTPREKRDSLNKVASILKTNLDTIQNDVERLGLSDLVIPAAELTTRRAEQVREEGFRNRESIYKKYYKRFKIGGIKFTYVDIALEQGLDYGRVKSDIKRLNMTDMIKEPVPTCTFEERVAYYRQNAEFFKSMPNLLKTCKKLGLRPSQVYHELEHCKILKPKSERTGTTLIDNSIDDDVYGNMYFSDRDLDLGINNGSMSYDELNRTLGFSQGHFREDTWGKYGGNW
jgi:hypothetical protein